MVLGKNYIFPISGASEAAGNGHSASEIERAKNEEIRQSNEAERQKAEEERIAAEEERKAGYTDMKNTIEQILPRINEIEAVSLDTVEGWFKKNNNNL